MNLPYRKPEPDHVCPKVEPYWQDGHTFAVMASTILFSLISSIATECSLRREKHDDAYNRDFTERCLVSGGTIQREGATQRGAPLFTYCKQADGKVGEIYR